MAKIDKQGDIDIDDMVYRHNEPAEPDEMEMPDYGETRLSSVLEEIGGTDAEIKIYRQSKTDGRGGTYLFTVGSDDADITGIQDTLRDEYGGGNFRVQVRRDGRLLANRTLAVESRKRPPERDHGAGGLADVLGAIQESNRQQMEMMREQMYRQQQETMRYQLENAKQQSEMMARLFESRQSQPDQNANILDTLLKARDFIAPQNSGDAMENFLRGLEMGRDLGGSDDALSTAIRTFGGALGNMPQLPQLPENLPKNPPGQPAASGGTPRPAPGAQPSPPAGAQPQPQPENGDFDMKNLIPYINMLLQGARQESDPVSYAIIVMDAVPEAVLRAWIVPDETYARLATHPLAAPHKAWLDKVREEVLMFLADLQMADNDDGSDNVSDGSDPERPAGDRGDVAPNAGMGQSVQGEPGSTGNRA